MVDSVGMSAANAYMRAAQAGANIAQPASGSDDNMKAAGAAFGNMLTNAVSNTQQAGATAENAITSAAVGGADLVDVVTAVAAAEATLETAVAVRDEVIKAYQEVMRMPI
jgi:flagellar hook-basal body complex protein FliE